MLQFRASAALPEATAIEGRTVANTCLSDRTDTMTQLVTLNKSLVGDAMVSMLQFQQLEMYHK